MSLDPLAVLRSIPESAPPPTGQLAPRERELLTGILSHAERLSGADAGLLRLVQTAISRSVGEVLLQTTIEEAGSQVLEALRPVVGPHPPKRKKPPKRKVPHPPGRKRRHPRKKKRHHPKERPPKKKGPHPPGRKPPKTKRRYPEAAPAPQVGPHPPKPGPGRSPLRKGSPKRSPKRAPAKRKGTRRAAQAVAPAVLKAACVPVEEFLMPAELEKLMAFTLQHERDFEISEVVSPGAPGGGMVDHEYRRSRVLMELGAHEDRILQRIQAMLPGVLRKLELKPFTTSRAEVQITASNDGDFFRDHSDNGQDDIASRALTFVYFYHREPKAFTGGELRIYDSRRDGDTWERAGAGRRITPEQNQIVFFPSELVHEITPVVCPKGGFADSRFTVNGWLHR